MRILVTGASGQVGGALRTPLEALGSVIAPDIDQLDLSRRRSNFLPSLIALLQI
jgi:dTDP-4-dehydrorhamnose reductase